ncbi:MAG: peptidoglycan-binding protein [Nitrospirota bacterium]|nr:peptidoglycan-binding protein [Nitrospirota bacterium]
MLSDLQKKSAQAIVNIFETGKALGDYGRVTLLPGDSGHLTYGRAQTTLASGNLYLLVTDYCEADDALLATSLKKYLKRLANRDLALDGDVKLRSLLKEAGDDPVMQLVQDEFFDRVYWTPSVQHAEAIGVTSGLGIGVVYDSHIHGSWDRIRARTDERHQSAQDIGEQQWIAHYVAERREWLATHSNLLLQRTVYRMAAFREMIDEGRWGLPLPFHVRGVRVDEGVLGSGAPVRVSAEEVGVRVLMLQTPRIKGKDVTIVQQALIRAGLAISVDGTFGPTVAKAVTRFQQKQGLKADGIVGPATRAALGL